MNKMYPYLASLLMLLLCTQISNTQSSTNKKQKIVYIMDAQCGWCYGNSDNITQIYEKYKDQIDFEIMVGGMSLGENAYKGGPIYSDFIAKHSPRLIEMTGVILSDKFYKLTKDPSYTFSSLEPDLAIYAVKSISSKDAFIFAKEVQTALYKNGQKLDELSTYLPILNKLNIDVDTFTSLWLSDENKLAAEREMTYAYDQVEGFPSLLTTDGESTKMLTWGYTSYVELETLIESMLNE